MEEAITAHEAVTPIQISELQDATKINEDMLARVERAEQFDSDAKEVFRVTEHRSMDRSVPLKAIEMLQLKNMASDV
jgi:hypothetical protein